MGVHRHGTPKDLEGHGDLGQHLRWAVERELDVVVGDPDFRPLLGADWGVVWEYV
jgi:hypothetical protein